MDDSTTKDDEKKFCEGLKNLGTNAHCLDLGDPDHKGVGYVTLKATEAELKSMLSQHLPHIKYGEPDSPVSIDDPEPDPSLIEEAARPPWGLDRIDDSTGTDGSYQPPVNSKEGDGAHVYVADTGIRTEHIDFEGRALPEFDYFRSGSDKACPKSDTNCGMDRHGHGTHCAGTVGGKTYGVAKKTALYALKVLGDRGRGSTAGIVASVNHVMANGKRPAVWSASLGGSGRTHVYADIFVKAKADNILISVAAGNSNSDACFFSPAFAPAAITVGATSDSDTRASFSNFGKCIDIFAPGVGVLSAGHKSNTATATMSGTSMACPHVSGVAALIYGDWPGVSATDVEANMKGWAGQGQVKDAKPASPNLMLHVPNWTPGGPITTFTTTAPPPTTTTTTTTPIPPPPGTSVCSFESASRPYCGLWADARGDKFDWSRRTGRTPSSSTGPDKASHGNYYLFIETSYPRKMNDNAIVSTNKAFQIGSAAFLCFDYHMVGASMGTLKVSVSEGASFKDVVFEKKGAQGSNWNSENISLAQYTGKSLTFAFEGIRGSSWQGDIAIDNVMLFAGAPGGGGPPSTTGAPPSTTGAPPSTTGAPPGTTGAPPSTTGATPGTTGAPSPPSGDLGKKVDALQRKVDEIIKLLKSWRGGGPISGAN
jgi:hypothetical protein